MEESIFEKIMTENLPELLKCTTSQIWKNSVSHKQDKYMEKSTTKGIIMRQLIAKLHRRSEK